ncbi:MAG: glycosyltransferase family 39 protein [Acidobacteria bacterium]|nr:glycosyltransferase family 39 protein [Acidobacteriota bacterium]
MLRSNNESPSINGSANSFGKLLPANVKDTLLVFCASYLFFVLFFWLGSVLIPNKDSEIVPLSFPSVSQIVQNMNRSDTGWYLTIIEQGYERKPFSLEKQANWAFFPAYPLAVKLVAKSVSADYVLVGCMLSATFYLLALYALWNLLAFDFDRETIFRTLLFLAFYPFAFDLVGFGPESLFLLCTCLSLYCARKEKWIFAGLLGGIASATRPQGILLFIPLLYMYLSSRDFAWKRIDRHLLSLGLLPSGLLLFMLYLYRLTGNAFAFTDIQKTWGNTISYPFSFLVQFLQSPKLISHYGWNPEFLSVVFTLTLVPILYWVWVRRAFPLEYRLFLTLHFLILVSRTTSMSNLRYILGMFPYFLALGILGKNQRFFLFVLLFFAGLLSLFLVLFANNYRIAIS